MTQEWKKRRKIPNYRISTFTSVPTHPLGVKPSGNAFLDETDSKDSTAKRKELLGHLSVLPEDLLIELLSYVDDPKSLQSLGCSSRILYAYTYDEELWRRLYTKEYLRLEALDPAANNIEPFGCSDWKGSWRKTILKLGEEALPTCKNLIFSDALFRPYQCSKLEYTELFQKIIDFERRCYELGTSLNTDFGVPRYQESQFSVSEFHNEFINRPFILQSSRKDHGDMHSKFRWPKWTLEDLLKRFPNETFRQEAVKWNLSLYSHYFKDNKDESPLYLFDCSSAAIKMISEEYEAPDIYQNDYFKLFQQNGVNCRPDHRWLIVGPARSGSTFHKDPNHTSAWNVGLSGAKLWILIPPGENPPGVMTDTEEEEVTSPVGIAEWILCGYYNDAVKLAHEGRCQICVTFAGECIYVPSGWWHSVINLTDSVALTENFVPEPIVPKVLNFFKNKPRQISGFHMKDFLESVRTFLAHHNIKKGKIASNDNINTLEKFIRTSDRSQIDNEDCGVLNIDELHPPIFEFFVELIDASQYSSLSSTFLEKMRTIEMSDRQEKKKQNSSTRESEAWNDLTREPSTSFSFGFSFEE